MSKRNNEPIEKGFNFGALAEQVISGNLARDIMGRFANKNQLTAIRKRVLDRIRAILKKAAERKAEKEKKKAETAARRAATKASRAASRKKAKSEAKKDKEKEKAKNREEVFSKLIESGLISGEELAALQTLRDGGQIDPVMARRLAQKGLAEIDENGMATISGRAGARSLLNAANRGDFGDAQRYLQEARQRMEKIKERIANKQQDIQDTYSDIQSIQADLQVDQNQLNDLQAKLSGEIDPIKQQALQIRIQRLENRMADRQQRIRERQNEAAKTLNEIRELQERHGLTAIRDAKLRQANQGILAGEQDKGQGNKGKGQSKRRGENKPQSESDRMLDEFIRIVLSENGEIVEKGKQYDSQSVMIVLEGKPRATAIRMAEMIDAEYLTEKGREFQPHITIKYGFPEWVTVEDIQRASGLFQPFKVCFGQVSLFERDEFDVVKVEVEGQELRRLNKLVSFLPNQDTRVEYHPHVTLAYVQPGLGWMYCNLRNELLNTEYEVREIVFSDTDGQLTVIPLGEVSKNRNDAPGYRLSDDSQVRCSNCLFAVRDKCELYDFEFDEGFVCQSWISEVEIEKIK